MHTERQRESARTAAGRPTSLIAVQRPTRIVLASWRRLSGGVLLISGIGLMVGGIGLALGPVANIGTAGATEPTTTTSTSSTIACEPTTTTSTSTTVRTDSAVRATAASSPCTGLCPDGLCYHPATTVVAPTTVAPVTPGTEPVAVVQPEGSLAPTPVVAAATAALPLTGSSTDGLTWVGIALVALGLLLVILASQRPGVHNKRRRDV
jgi:LPXTG-motif cell wall-anchored protein